MFDWGSVPSLEATPGIANGAWVFKGTRVPVRALISNLGHATVEEFCEQFPNVSQEQVETVLEYMAESLIEDIVVAPTTEASPRLGWWALLRAVVGPVGAWLAISFPILFLASGLGFLEVEAAWLAPLLEVAVTPVALVVTLTFGTATVLLASDAPLSET